MARNWLILGLLLAVFALKGLLLVPPAPSASAEFNVERAIGRLERILGDQRPHPVDSEANDAVRERLIAELRAIGLQPEIRAREDCRGLPGFRTISCSLTRNVIAVIGGEKPGKALLLNAHYDSTPAGPGAADDGIGVATMLEVATILGQCKTPFVPSEVEGRVSTGAASPLLDTNGKGCPEHPIILLFNEGEEFGLNGAGAFIDGDPLAAQVGSLINIEARGVSGPAFMFETSEPNGPAIGAFAAASRRPYANSLTADFAKLIPNYTDVVVFKHRGWTTLSYAIVGNETRYHSPGDRVEALSRRSLQHMGSEVLAATRTLPNASEGGQRVYADIAGRLLLSLPILLAGILLAGLVAGLGFVTWRARAFWRPLLITAGMIVAGVAAAFALVFVAGFVRAGDYWRAWPLISYLATYATLLAAMLAVLAWLGRRVSRDRLRIAAWLTIALLGGLLSLVMPGATIFFLIAPALALLGFLLARARTALLWAAALVQLLMFAELLASLELLLVDGPLWAVAPVAALAALPFLAELHETRLKWQLLALVLVAAGLWAAAMLAPRSSAERPLAFTIDYVRDDDSGKAHWAVASKQAPLPHSWHRLGAWKRGTLPYSGRLRWLAEAPDLDAPLPAIETISEIKDRGSWRVRLRLSTGGANMIMLRIEDNVPVRAMGLPGALRPTGKGMDGEPAILRCSGRGCDGLVVEIELGGKRPIDATLIGVRFGLPLEGARLQALRPKNAHTQYGADSSIRITPITL